MLPLQGNPGSIRGQGTKIALRLRLGQKKKKKNPPPTPLQLNWTRDPWNESLSLWVGLLGKRLFSPGKGADATGRRLLSFCNSTFSSVTCLNCHHPEGDMRGWEPGLQRHSRASVPALNCLLQHWLWIPSRALGASRPFCVPPFLWWQKIGFLQPPRLPWVLKGRFKQLLIREGRGYETREKQSVRRNSNVALGQAPGSPLRDTHHSSFELFCRYWRSSGGRSQQLTMVCSSQGHRLNDGMQSTGALTPDQLDLKFDDADSNLPHRQPIRRMSTSWSRPVWTITTNLLTILSKLGHIFPRQESTVSPFAWQSY